ncbi:STAS domain-containing protein [Nonomuraea sp. NPDC050783]|uniref:STAS domain-containing protein n=1 Tax=Nonomuraea sp. NPDC050783 TaxID=3154634 RepID=UPI00346537BE
MISLAGGDTYVTPVLHPFGLRLSGQIDRDTRHLLARSLTWAARMSDGDLHLDLGALAFIDAGGLRLIVTCAAELPAPRRVVLRPATPLVGKLLVLLGWQVGGDLRLYSAGVAVPEAANARRDPQPERDPQPDRP